MFYLVSDNNDDEATGDNRTLFSEIQVSGDVNEFKSNTNTLDADFRLSRLRRSPLGDQRASSSLSTTSQTVVKNNQVLKLIQQFLFFYLILSYRNFLV